MKKLSFHPCGNYRENYAQELTIFETWFGRVCLGVFLILLFGVAPFVLSPYLLYILNTIGILAIAAIGLNILIGYTGQISLGHGAFFGVGAYAAAILATRLGVAFLSVHSRRRSHYRHGRHDLRHSLRPTQGTLSDHRHAGRSVHHRIRPDSVGKPDQRNHGHHVARTQAFWVGILRGIKHFSF